MRTIITTLSLILLAFLAILPASAVALPEMTVLRPFSSETNYLSQAGYLRYLVFDQRGKWLTRDEALAYIDEQMEDASR